MTTPEVAGNRRLRILADTHDPGGKPAATMPFGTTREAMLSADRHRAVSDARAVAMTAARRDGMTLTSIAAFGKDHTSVMHNSRRC
jgi:chromosomal replication initiation ATPase DnaA